MRTPRREDFEKDGLIGFAQVEEAVCRRDFKVRRRLADLRFADHRRLRSGLHAAMFGAEKIEENRAGDDDDEHGDRPDSERAARHAFRSFRSTAKRAGRIVGDKEARSGERQIEGNVRPIGDRRVVWPEASAVGRNVSHDGRRDRTAVENELQRAERGNGAREEAGN